MYRSLISSLVLCALLFIGCGTAEDASPSEVVSSQKGDAATETFTATPTERAPSESTTVDVQATPSSSEKNQVEVDRTPELMPPCDSITAGLEPAISGMVELAWYSSIVVVGTVESAGKPYVIDSSGALTIATDYTVVIDTPIRGVVGRTVAVRQFGGQIGDCQQLYEGDPAFAIADRVLLFLTEVEGGPVGTARLYPVGQKQGVWLVTDNELVTNDVILLQTESQPLETAIAEIVSGLEGMPPSGRLADLFLVPLEESPIVAELDATP